MTWKTHNGVDHPSTYLLCRCGQSQNKPFCDGSHAFDLFEGTETAPTNTYEERAEVHEGPGLTLYRDPGLCQHAGFCTNKVRTWFDMVPDTEDQQVRVQLLGMIEHCPSGSLVYETMGERIEPDLPAEIAPITDGPLFVSGRIELERADDEPVEVRNRMTLCRCGGSSNKPFCDGTHYDNGFSAPVPTNDAVAVSVRRSGGGVAD
jgi:CDGSH-type Zn-finger protein